MIKPLRDYVVLEKLPEEKKIGSILVAKPADKDSAVAKVVAVGPGTTDEKGKEVKVIAKDKMEIVTVNKPGSATDDDILDSKRRLNVFAEKATGFDAKARMKRAQKKAKEGKL